MSIKITFLRTIRLCIPILLTSILIAGFKSREGGVQTIALNQCLQEETDSLIWGTAMQFTTYFNKRDTASMNHLLPEDFMLQLLHDNFLGKQNLLNMMMDTAVQATFQHYLKRNSLSLIRYSDDNRAASLDVSIGFLDRHMAESVKKERGYGLCIMFFQKINSRWWLKTVHLDLHCSLCNE